MMLENLLILAQDGDGAAGAAIGMGFLCVVVFGILISLASLALLIYAVLDAVRNPQLDDTQRLIWVLVILLVGPIGALIYLLAGRNK